MRLVPLLCQMLTGAMLTVVPRVSGNFEDTVPALMLCTQDVTPCVRAQRLHASSQDSVLAITVPDSIVAHTISDKSICDLDSILVAKVAELTTSSAKALSTNSSLRRRALEVPSQVTFQHVSKSHGDLASELRHQMLRMCASPKRGSWKSTSNADLTTLQEGERMILSYDVELHDLERLFNESVPAFMRTHPNSVIIVTTEVSSPRSNKWSRRAQEEANQDNRAAPVVHEKSGLFHRYQFFSTGLLVGIVVVALLLMPAAFYATQLLSSIETPDQLGKKARPSATKKQQ